MKCLNKQMRSPRATSCIQYQRSWKCILTKIFPTTHPMADRQQLFSTSEFSPFVLNFLTPTLKLFIYSVMNLPTKELEISTNVIFPKQYGDHFPYKWCLKFCTNWIYTKLENLF